MSAPLVSVIIDTYNHARFIEEAVESVLSQDFPQEQMEVLIVDDGSTDDTATRVKKYGERVRYLYKANGGQASAFNFGFAHTAGDVIALLDGDDTWLPGKLRRVIEEFAKHPQVGMVYHPYLEVDMQTGETRKSRYAMVSGSLFENTADFFTYGAPGTAASFRRSCLAQVMPIPEEGLRSQADAYIEMLVPFIAPILAIPDCLATYRLHDSNLYHSDEPSVEFLKKRTATTQVWIDASRSWLQQHGFRGDVVSKNYIGANELWNQRNKFKVDPPGRLRFFIFLLKETHCESAIQNPKVTMFNYATAPLGLMFGYKNAHTVNNWRAKALDFVHDAIGKVLNKRVSATPGSRHNKESQVGSN